MKHTLDELCEQVLFVSRRGSASFTRPGSGAVEWNDAFEFLLRTNYKSGKMTDITLEDGTIRWRFKGRAPFIIIDSMNDGNEMGKRDEKAIN